MLDLWFGLDASGFDKASAPRQIRAILTFFMSLAGRFHPLFGPVLMVTYACLSNTLLLTGTLRLLLN